ncbi:hypothetical protein Fmac_015327 [Flemingia macrophylla]|uniref:Uncharacterized protein n=1 Tax=Flemingia macrophylla TaxID=520843 RepID=A0ABD1MEF2_9FABA
MSILRLMLQTPIADHHKRETRGVHDVATDTSSKTRKLEGKLDAIVNLQSGVDEHPEAYTQTPIARHHKATRDKARDREDGSQLLAFGARNDAIIIKGVHDVAIDTSALKLERLEGKLDAIVNLVTQQATNQKPTSVPRVCGIRSSNDHHTSVCPSSQQSGVDENPEAYAANTYSTPRQQGVHDVARDTSTETRKLVGKLDALVNLVTQQVTNQNPASDARVCGIRSSNDNHIRVCPSLQQSGVDEHPWLMLQTPIADHHNSRDKGVLDVASDTSAKTRKPEGKVDTFVNLVTQLAANRSLASVARVCTRFGARNDVIGIRGVHDVATDISAETRKLEGVHDVATNISAETRKMEGKLDALVNLVTRLVRIISLPLLQESAASVLPMTTILVSVLLHKESGVYEHPKTYAANTYSRPPQRREKRHLIEKLEGKLDAFVNLLTLLAANPKAASVARVYDIRSSNDHHTSVCPSSQQSGVDEHPEAYALQTPIADHHKSSETRYLIEKMAPNS